MIPSVVASRIKSPAHPPEIPAIIGVVNPVRGPTAGAGYNGVIHPDFKSSSHVMFTPVCPQVSHTHGVQLIVLMDCKWGKY